VLAERGTATPDAAPLDGAAVGDPRFGATVRLFGQPDRDAVSLAAAAYLWIPVGAEHDHAGDATARFAQRLLAAGALPYLRWAASLGFLVRPDATLAATGPGAGATASHELQLGAALAWVDARRELAVGPEAVFATQLTGGRFFKEESTSLELLAGASYLVAGLVQVGAAVGLGLLREPGTPDARLLVRVAYAPAARPGPPADTDGDGIPDAEDACPRKFGWSTDDPATNGCPPPRPPRDRDDEAAPDFADECPDDPVGLVPNPRRTGCPLDDSDGDGVPDDIDACPDEPGAPSPNPRKNGCPGLVMVRGDRIVVQAPVQFAPGTDLLLAQSRAPLDAVVRALAAMPAIRRVAVEAHTDNAGVPMKNRLLSQLRAAVVVRYLVEHGIAPTRLEARGFGDTRPIRPNATQFGRAANRRVEFHIVEPAGGAEPARP
jgi:outer membrane protein OmpA-like peptidoglycan-associated protein